MAKKNAVKSDAEGTRRRKRQRLHEVSLEHDMKYRGPINYQGFQVLGWFCIVLTVLAAILRLYTRVENEGTQGIGTLTNILDYVSSLSLPFLLIANFSKILSNKEGYRKQLLRNGAAAFGIAAAAGLLFTRYILGTMQLAVTDPDQVLPVMTEMFASYNKSGYVAFNLFIDLFLCTLTMFFLNARPKRVFTGKKVLILRFCTIIPIAYEAASLWLKVQAALGRIVLPFWCFPLLPVKPPMTFVLFVFLAIHVKGRERRFRRHGRSHEEYLAFLETNRNSFHFSVYLFALIVITVLLDVILLLAAATMVQTGLGGAGDAERIVEALNVCISVGIGESIPMVFAAPFVLLYSYNRNPKRKIISMLAPAAAIILIILILFEGMHQMIGGFMADKKISVRQLTEGMTDQAAPEDGEPGLPGTQEDTTDSGP